MTSSTKEREDGLARRVGELRADLKRRDMPVMAENIGASYNNGRFQLVVWNSAVIVSDLDFIAIDEQTATPCDPLTQAMLAYYFHTSNGAPVANRWIAFNELPNGRFYASAYQGYTGNRLATEFGNNLETFGQAARLSGGTAEAAADSAYRFQALPKVPIAVFCWYGDEDFPPSYRVLFDESISNHLPTDACAILGSMITSALCTPVVK